MRFILEENRGLPASLLWTLAIVAGISVANLYYNQPLLNLIRKELNTSEFTVNLIAMLSQIGYASGLLLIIPLGDLYQRKKIILINFSILVFSLLTMAVSKHIAVILFASFLTGACSVMPQIFIPIAAQFSVPKQKGRNVGIVVSGLLTGILGSRVISGLVGDYLGWRLMYLIAACLMLASCIVMMRILPEIRPTFKGKYRELMFSLVSLIKEYPLLRLYSIRSGLAFGSFLALWSTLAFKMGEAPFYAGSDVVGLLGLCGITGALSASFVGSCVQKTGVHRFNLLGSILMLFAWLLLLSAANHYTGIITGIIILDIGMQCIQLSNQTCIFNLCPAASNRVNTIFMTTYFIGGSLGTFLAGSSWQIGGWTGVATTGMVLAGCSLLITLWTKR